MNNTTENIETKDGNSKAGVARKEARLVVSLEAEAAVSEFTDAVNDGFEAGRATRFDVASFMIQWFMTHSTSDAIFEIRRQLASSFSMLDAIHKKAKSSGDLPPEVKAALEQYFFGAAAQGQKKVKKNLKQDCITDTHDEREAA